MRASLERLGLWAMAAGILLWLAAPAWMDIGYDGNAYIATGHGWARTGELRMAWGDTLTWWIVDGDTDLYGHSHHFPPAYSWYLGGVLETFGYGLAQAKAAAIAMALFMLGTVYACTRDLYGRTAAAVVGGAVALAPQHLWVTGMGFSENLGTLLFTVTMWGILKSLRKEWYIVPAGLAAGAAYLSRASMGAFFLIAGVGGLLWRIHHRGFRRTFTSVPYLLAIAVFGAVVAAWARRNVTLFDDWSFRGDNGGFEMPYWETSPGVRGLSDWIQAHPGAFVEGLVVRAPLLLAAVLPPMVLLWPECRASLRRIRDEHTSGLWLSVALLYVLGLYFAAAYYSLSPSPYERWRLDNLRYMMVGLVPVLWALVRESDLDDPAARKRWATLGVVFVVGCAAVLMFPAQQLPNQAARELEPWLQPGDGIEMWGTGKYAMYSTLERPQDYDVWVQGHGNGRWAEFILATYRAPQPVGYTLVAEKVTPHPVWNADPDVVQVWVRDDVQAERQVGIGTMRPGW